MGEKNRFYADIMAIHPEVTGSCILVVVKRPDNTTVKFVVDCGLFQERDYSKNNEYLPFEADGIDFCMVTHNHVDHTGRLPYMIKKGYHNKIYTTSTTAKLLPLALQDSCRVLRDVYKRANLPSLYDDMDVERTISLIESYEYNNTFEIDSKNVKVTFFNNGHLMGAASILVQISYPECEDINLFFSGDYNNKNMFFDVQQLPDWVLNLPITVIQESTYGDMNSTEITKCFKANVEKCVKDGGTVVAPVFSLGRSQEILYELKCMQDEGSLDKNIPIFFDGRLAIKYTFLYLNDGLDIKEEMRNFIPENLTWVDKGNRSEVLEDKNVKIILTTSGMGSYGPAQIYIPEYIARSNSLIHFTGYTSEGPLGARLKEAVINENVQVGGMIVKKRAQVEYTTEYSAHAKADEMLEFLKKFNFLKLVLVNHGELNAKEIFAERIVNEVKPKGVGILGCGYLFRVNPYGLIKNMSTKFE